MIGAGTLPRTHAAVPLRARVLRLARRSALASVGVIIVGLVIVTALGAPLLATTDPIDQDLTVVLKPPFWLEDGSLQHPLAPIISDATSTRA